MQDVEKENLELTTKWSDPKEYDWTPPESFPNIFLAKEHNLSIVVKYMRNGPDKEPKPKPALQEFNHKEYRVYPDLADWPTSLSGQKYFNLNHITIGEEIQSYMNEYVKDTLGKDFPGVAKAPWQALWQKKIFDFALVQD